MIYALSHFTLHILSYNILFILITFPTLIH